MASAIGPRVLEVAEETFELATTPDHRRVEVARVRRSFRIDRDEWMRVDRSRLALQLERSTLLHGHRSADKPQRSCSNQRFARRGGLLVSCRDFDGVPSVAT